MALPTDDNLHMLVSSSWSREKVADVYSNEGWTANLLDDDKTTANFSSSFADLTFNRLNKTEFLLNGAVEDLSTNFDNVVLPLLNSGLARENIKPDEIEDWP